MIGLKVKELFFIKRKAIRTQSTQYNIQWISHTFLEITEMAQTTNKLIFPILENDIVALLVSESGSQSGSHQLLTMFPLEDLYEIYSVCVLVGIKFRAI